MAHQDFKYLVYHFNVYKVKVLVAHVQLAFCNWIVTNSVMIIVMNILLCNNDVIEFGDLKKFMSAKIYSYTADSVRVHIQGFSDVQTLNFIIPLIYHTVGLWSAGEAFEYMEQTAVVP